MGAPGRGYVEKMIEGVTTLNLAGNLTVVGDTDASGGTLLYRMASEMVYEDIALTEADSGKVIGIGATGLTASLPDASDIGTKGIHYTFVTTVVSAFDLTASAGGSFLGHLNSNTGVVATSPPQARMTGTDAYITDRFHVASTGTGFWLIIDGSVVDHAKWAFATS